MLIAICDDENEIRQHLAGSTRRLYPDADIQLYESGEKLLIADKPADILFLDIQMHGKNGMETARQLRNKNKKTIIIFITVIEDYVYQAFDVGAFNYLVKPFSDERFARVLRSAVEQYYEIFSQTDDAEDGEKYLMIKTKGTQYKVLLDDIIYAEVFNRKVLIHKADGDLEYYGKMSELENAAGEGFFRPHRAYLINFKYVEKYNSSTIWLKRGTALIAKKNYPQLVKSYMKYNQKHGKQ